MYKRMFYILLVQKLGFYGRKFDIRSTIMSNTKFKEFIRVLVEPTKLFLAQSIFGLAEYYIRRVLSGPIEFYLDQYLFGPSFIWTDRISSRPGFISTEFYLDQFFQLSTINWVSL